MLTRYGTAVLAERAMPQLARWESRFGWTRTGFGAVSERETSLASVLARLLPDPDAWVACADEYLKALDRLAQTEPARAKLVYGYDSTGLLWDGDKQARCGLPRALSDTALASAVRGLAFSGQASDRSFHAAIRNLSCSAWTSRGGR
jgi:hypothetical protein